MENSHTLTKMAKKELFKARAEVIDIFINIEMTMNFIISQHYLNRLDKSFIFYFLYDEYFAFALRRRILEKVVKNINKKKIEDLNRLNTIRNYFAHTGQKIIFPKEAWNNEKVGFVPDPRDPNKPIDFNKLYKEFMRKAPSIGVYLRKILEEKGCQIKKVKDR